MVNIKVGDIVTVDSQTARQAGGFGARNIANYDRLEVTRVFKERFIGRFGLASYSLAIEDIRTVNDVRVLRPGEEREIGEKPADTPEQEHIALDDPRIQWIFEDMGRYADEQGWCDSYDNLAEEFGIPSRYSQHAVDFVLDVNGRTVEFTVNVWGRDQDDAREQFLESMRELS